MRRNLRDLKTAVREAFTRLPANTPRGPFFGPVLLNGGWELTLRSLILACIQRNLPDGRIVVTEHTPPRGRRKRADIAILRRNDKNPRSGYVTAGLIELKGNFLFQTREFEKNAKSDLKKWRFYRTDGAPIPILFTYFVVEVTTRNEHAREYHGCLKRYARDQGGSHKDQLRKVSEILLDHGFRKSRVYAFRTHYPCGISTVRVHCYFSGRRSGRRTRVSRHGAHTRIKSRSTGRMKRGGRSRHERR